MKTLYDNLPMEEMNEDEAVYSYGDSIAEQFYYGNFSYSVEQLREMVQRPKDFLEYLENKAEELGINDVCSESFYGGHFRPDFWIALGAEMGQ